MLKVIAPRIHNPQLTELFSHCDEEEYQWEAIHRHLLVDDVVTAALVRSGSKSGGGKEVHLPDQQWYCLLV